MTFLLMARPGAFTPISRCQLRQTGPWCDPNWLERGTLRRSSIGHDWLEPPQLQFCDFKRH